MVDLSPVACLALRAHLEALESYREEVGVPLTGEDLVFANPDGQPLSPSTVSHAFGETARRAGLNGIRFHDLRHSHASLLMKQGTNPKIVQERLGHSGIAITLDIYNQVLPGVPEGSSLEL